MQQSRQVALQTLRFLVASADGGEIGDHFFQLTRLQQEIVAAPLQCLGETSQETVEPARHAGGLMRDVCTASFEVETAVRPSLRLVIRRGGRRFAICELHALLLFGAFFIKAGHL